MTYSLRNMTAFLVARIFILTGMVRKAVKKAEAGEHLLSIYCHAPGDEVFESCIRWLQNEGFRFLSLGDLESIRKGEAEFPKKGVVLTVDDGWSSNQENIFRITSKYEIPVAIFISTQPVEEGVFWWSYIKEGKRRKLHSEDIERMKKIPDHARVNILKNIKERLIIDRQALTKKQVSEIAKNKFVSVGSHTVSHPILVNCTDEDAKHEIAYSKAKIETWISRPVRYFSYPNGDYGKRELDLVKLSGYSLALTTEAKYLTRERLQQQYSLPRFEILDDASLAENICRMTGVWQTVIK